MVAWVQALRAIRKIL